MKTFVEITLLCYALSTAPHGQPAKVQDSQNEREYSVCSLSKNAKALDGHYIVLRGNLVATMESVRVQNKECGREIYVSYQSGQEESKWQDWEKAVNDQVGMLDLRPVEVTLEGVFHRRVGHGQNAVAQLELRRVLAVSYLTSSPFR